MRTAVWTSICALTCTLGGCGEDDPSRELLLSIGTASVAANTMAPEALASLDITAEVEANIDTASVQVTDVRIVALPETDGSAELVFAPSVRGPQDAPALELPGGEVVVARITNAGTTNAELTTFCGSAVALRVTVEGGGVESTDERDLTVTCS